MADFNLRQLVRDVIATSTLTSPRDIASEAFRRISPDEYAAALQQCLATIARKELQDHRDGPDPSMVMAERVSPTPSGSTAARPARAAARALPKSTKASRCREWWKEKLRGRYHVGPGSEDWLMLGDCEYTHVMFMAAERRAMAARNTARAEECEAIGAALLQNSVQRVRELPEDVLRRLLAGLSVEIEAA